MQERCLILANPTAGSYQAGLVDEAAKLCAERYSVDTLLTEQPGSSEAVLERGLATTGTDGLNLWVSVPDEQAALVMLAARGIAVAPGRPRSMSAACAAILYAITPCSTCSE